MNGRPTSSLVCEVDIKAAVHIVHNNNVAIDTKSGMKIVADTEKLWLRRPGNLAPEKIRLSSIKSVCYTLFEMIYEDNGGQSSLCVVSKTKADRLNNLTEWIRRYADREAFDMPSEKLALYLDKVDLDESQRMPTRGTPVVPGASLRTTAKSPITIDGSIRRSARLSGVPSVGISQERDNTIMFRFPPDQPLSITVTAYEKTRLADGEFLNDTVIEFYIRYLAFVHPDWYKEVHIFNSFFFQKLSPRDKPFTKEEGYEAVKRWTKNVDIFAKDFIIIPINESLHWYLSIVCYPGRALSQEIVVSDTEAESDKSGPIYQTISPDKPSDDVSEPMQVDAPGSLHGGGDWTPVYHHTERIPAHASPSNSI
ncbi:hypothetical protein EDD86DRAFT_73031 [Gorgonomyces haynaldii]|nr:hypothetical protein EDD86DRAFT_73031 [Gorgonomyces haynaldii]